MGLALVRFMVAVSGCAEWGGSLQLFAARLCILKTGRSPGKRENMKNVLSLSAAVAAFSILANVAGADPEAGYVDFGKFTPTSGSEFVEVNVNSNLITMVANFARKHEPEVAEALKGLKAIRVNVVGLNESNREDLEKRINSVRAQLDKAGWERLVTVIKDRDDVGVFMKTRGPEAVEGIVVTVLKGKDQAVFVNVVGDIRPDKLATVGERFNIEPLKHLPGKPKELSSKN
jgi:hypothetical protein